MRVLIACAGCKYWFLVLGIYSEVSFPGTDKLMISCNVTVHQWMKHKHCIEMASIDFSFLIAGSDYHATQISVTFEGSADSMQTLCGTVAIINDMVADEPDEQFSVRLTSATPIGNLGQDETCVTIIDDDSE